MSAMKYAKTLDDARDLARRWREGVFTFNVEAFNDSDNRDAAVSEFVKKLLNQDESLRELLFAYIEKAAARRLREARDALADELAGGDE